MTEGLEQPQPKNMVETENNYNFKLEIKLSLCSPSGDTTFVAFHISPLSPRNTVMRFEIP